MIQDYADVERLFHRAVRIRVDNPLPTNGKEALRNLDDQRIRDTLAQCVEGLYLMHQEGLVETIEGLPTPKEVTTLDPSQTGSLMRELRTRYFPTESDLTQTDFYGIPYVVYTQ